MRQVIELGIENGALKQLGGVRGPDATCTGWSRQVRLVQLVDIMFGFRLCITHIRIHKAYNI